MRDIYTVYKRVPLDIEIRDESDEIERPSPSSF